MKNNRVYLHEFNAEEDLTKNVTSCSVMFARVGKLGPMKNITSFKRCHEITHGIKEKDIRDRYGFDKPLSKERYLGDEACEGF